MKKALILTAIMALTISASVNAQETKTLNTLPKKPECPCRMHRPPMDPAKMEEMKAKFEEQRVKFENDLELTDTQKEKMQTLRDKQQEEMKPILEKIKAKHQEEKAIFDQKLTVQERQQKLEPIRKDLMDLRKQMHQIRKNHKTQFEEILTDKQLKKLNKLKEEKKKEFQNAPKNHPPRHYRSDCGCK